MGALSDSVRAQRSQRQAARAPQEIVQEMVGYDPDFPNRTIASPLMYDERTGTYEWGIPQLAIDALENVVLPGAVLQGYQPSMSDVTEFGAGVGTGGIASSTLTGGAPRGALGMFAGPRAATADLDNLHTAKYLLQNRRENRLSRDQIRQETGWEPVPRPHDETRWRFEIPDDRAVLMDPADYNVPGRIAALADTAPTDYRNIVDLESTPNLSPDLTDLYFKLLDRNNILQPGSLGARLDHSELYRAYPGMAKTPTTFGELGGLRAVFNSPRGVSDPSIRDAPGSIRVDRNNPDPLSSILHEVQHGIQRYEGWPMGPDQNLPSNLKKRDYTAPEVQAAMSARAQAADRLRNAKTPEQAAAAREYLTQLDAYIERVAAHVMYGRHSGETEARLTQARQFMEALAREGRAPQANMDVPYFKQWD
jgi:hypothetical protein